MGADLLRDTLATLPLIILAAGAFLLLMLEVCLRRPWSREFIAVLTLAIAAVVAVAQFSDGAAFSAGTAGGRTLFEGVLYGDALANWLNVVVLVATMLAVLLTAGQVGREGVTSLSEYYSLILMATFGALVFANGAELITLFLGLEIMSMALYCLCGAILTQRRSTESALKYFLLGSFSSAFLLYGIALLYGLTGSTEIAVIVPKLVAVDQTTLLFATGMLLVGLVFKVGGVPFHFWAPDVYQGAPTAVTAYMATTIKLAAVAALLRVMWGTLGGSAFQWAGAVWLIAVLTMVVGNLVALRQRSVKRMLAYSSISHAGYVLCALLAPGEYGGGAAILYYMVVYIAMTLGAFGVLFAVATPAEGEEHDPLADDISRFNGLSRREPFLAAVMALFMLSLAGIPPGVGGLLGKFYVFGAAIRADYVGLALIGVLSSAISVYYYLRVVVAMYFLEPNENSVPLAQGASLIGRAVLVACSIAVVAIGIYPSLVYEQAVTLFPRGPF